MVSFFLIGIIGIGIVAVETLGLLTTYSPSSTRPLSAWRSSLQTLMA